MLEQGAACQPPRLGHLRAQRLVLHPRQRRDLIVDVSVGQG